MSSDEELADDPSESQDTGDEHSECKFIAERVKRYPEILEKSQIPAKKAKKLTAIEKVVSEYKHVFGKDLSSRALLKKVGNMKTRLKKKTDKNKTGNKRIPPLLTWETIMMEAMHADVNPTVAEIPGGLEVGVPLQAVRDVTAQLPPPPAVQSAKRKLAATGDGAMAPETEETRKLTNIQLQRLVLLEQLKVARLQQQYFSAKLKDRALPGPAFVQENEKTFEIL